MMNDKQEPTITDDGTRLVFSGAYASNFMIYSYVYSDPVWVFQKLIKRSSLDSKSQYTMRLSAEKATTTTLDSRGKPRVALEDNHRELYLEHLDKDSLIPGFVSIAQELGISEFNAIGFLSDTVLTVEAEGGLDVG